MAAITAAEVAKHVNELGMVPIKFLGVVIDPSKPEERAGEAGLGLRVGEVRGVSADVAVRMINLGTAELVVVPKTAKGAPTA